MYCKKTVLYSKVCKGLGIRPNERNELMYSLVFTRPLQFCIEENGKVESQVLEFTIIFNIFRIKKLNGTEETRLN